MLISLETLEGLRTQQVSVNSKTAWQGDKHTRGGVLRNSKHASVKQGAHEVLSACMILLLLRLDYRIRGQVAGLDQQCSNLRLETVLPR